MKSSDIGMMIVIAGVSAGIAIWATNMLLGNPDDATYKYTMVPSVISSAVAEPDVETFNINAINPTVDVYVESCKDLDGDGQISDIELQACNEVSGE